MQEYLTRTRLGAVMDHLGGTLLLLAGSLLLFTGLWGVRLSAFCAGAALFVMLMLLREKSRKSRLHRREAALRRRIGGEMKMEKWLVMQPRRAHLEAAQLLAKVYPLQLENALEGGVICALAPENEKILIACAQMPGGEKLSAGRVAAFQRECLRLRAMRGVLCAVGDVTMDAQRQAALIPGIVLIGRGRMISLAGADSPATDEQLIALGRRKHQGNIEKALLKTVLSPQRDRQYLFYGLLLSGMYLLTGFWMYLLPGCICLVCMALCRAQRYKYSDSDRL